MNKDIEVSKILEGIKKGIRPNDSILKHIYGIVDEINFLLKKNNINAICVIGGSIAKGTFLKHDYDIDIFIRFNLSYKDMDLSGMTDDILKILCSSHNAVLDRIHGSRDYFQFRIVSGRRIMNFEAIPVLHVHNSSEAQNITDMSPEHVEWVRMYTSKRPELRDEIRLAKQFCKANMVYGAESYINGFSGHIIDILVIHYGSFLKLIREFSKKEASIERPIIIDHEHKLKDPLSQLNKSKITPLIIVDPVQDGRNSAAALSSERLEMFINASRMFLARPSKGFFKITKFNSDKQIASALKSSGSKNMAIALHITMAVLDGSRDVVGTKALKAYEAMVAHLKLSEFTILSSGWNFDYNNKKADAYIIIKRGISKERIQEGPQVSSKEDYDKFVNKHKGMGHEISIEGSRAYAKVPREFTDPKKFLEHISTQGFIQNRIKTVKIEQHGAAKQKRRA